MSVLTITWISRRNITLLFVLSSISQKCQLYWVYPRGDQQRTEESKQEHASDQFLHGLEEHQ